VKRHPKGVISIRGGKKIGEARRLGEEEINILLCIFL
jgi:hypothetical protein